MWNTYQIFKYYIIIILYKMGQTLSEPVTEKETTLGEDSRMLYGASSMQGWRISKYKKIIDIKNK